MYAYTYDEETGGILLNSTPLNMSNEPRPVYYQELDLLGFDKYWLYDKDDSKPFLWAESNNYYYRGKLVAKTSGGSLYTIPKIIIVGEPEQNGRKLRFVDIDRMVEKNRVIMEALVQETIKKIYNTYVDYKDKVDVFYVAFSGGKDSIVALDLVQKALPHNEFKVIFGNTGMEFPDTYGFVEKVKNKCKQVGIEFFEVQSVFSPEDSWRLFGPPAVTIRWCCSVHKTTPQIEFLRTKLGKKDFRGMAFTGVRGDESKARSEYDDISFGKKHKGQYSFHVIHGWNTAELYNYIYEWSLEINKAYLKGHDRVGCLVCPMSTGKHEYIKKTCYPEDVLKFETIIKDTSIKKHDSQIDMTDFIDKGYWRTRKSGKELNFGNDKFLVEKQEGTMKIKVFDDCRFFVEWIKTIGNVSYGVDKTITVEYGEQFYTIMVEQESDCTTYIVEGIESTKNDIGFASLLGSVIIKSLYCVGCGVCVANCPYGCIKMSDNKIAVSNECKHCHQCHKIFSHCLRYNSIKNVKGERNKMVGLDRYFTFGVKKNAIEAFFVERGEDNFWNTDGNGLIPNKQKDAFLNFMKDAGVVKLDKKVSGDKYTKNKPTSFAEILFRIGVNDPATWALMVVNLVYTPQLNWYVKNVDFKRSVSVEEMKVLLSDVMENDSKGLGKRNVCDAIKNIMIRTPIGNELGLGICDYEEKGSQVRLRTITRTPWLDPNPKVILYSLYKFAEACDGYYQFTLTTLMDRDIERNGVSPTEIFGLDRSTMEKILNGLSANYSEFINANFTLDLDTINLRSDKKSADVLELF